MWYAGSRGEEKLGKFYTLWITIKNTLYQKLNAPDWTRPMCMCLKTSLWMISGYSEWSLTGQLDRETAKQRHTSVPRRRHWSGKSYTAETPPGMLRTSTCIQTDILAFASNTLAQLLQLHCRQTCQELWPPPYYLWYTDRSILSSILRITSDAR